MITSEFKRYMITLFNLNFKLHWTYVTRRRLKLPTIIYSVKVINEALCSVEMLCLDFIRRN